MIFSSHAFIFGFLPVVLAGFLILSRGHGRGAVAWLVASSLVFYGWWSPPHTVLIIASVMVNYLIGRAVAMTGSGRILAFGVIANLVLLGYYKYTGFLLEIVRDAAGLDLGSVTILLPLGISFFTFQQIAYLVDVHRGKATSHGFLDYALFVTFFPQLIAGPIVHQAEILPQIVHRLRRHPRAVDLAVGATVFVVGLFKKTVIGDTCAQYVDPVFDAARAGADIGLLEAWGGTLAYTFQIYFDFSGYSDMAMGLARLFGIRLPINFFSPYKSLNIIEFWRRWHVTLSRFLRDYLYIPLGGNRKGPARAYLNLMTVMLLGGLWHGADWTFAAWGGLHGLYLLVCHAWQAVKPWRGRLAGPVAVVTDGVAWGLTFLAVAFAWVFFRAETWNAALAVLRGLVGGRGDVLLPETYRGHLGPLGDLLESLGARFITWDFNTHHFYGFPEVAILAAAFVIATMLPNTSQFMARYRIALLDVPHLDQRRPLVGFRWRMNAWWAMVLSAMLVASLVTLSRLTAFIYYNF